MDKIDLSIQLMNRFYVRSGLSYKSLVDDRYLWTDAFAVFNYITLFYCTHDIKYYRYTENLIKHVHDKLGRHRTDDSRIGWISGLDEEEGRLHPTRGGLRIGKKFNERSPGKIYNANEEWNLDGQYFHYSTKWIRALIMMYMVSNDENYRVWAMELAYSTFNHFVYHDVETNINKIYWKMSIDLTRPLVSSMGLHDPLDGLITCLLLSDKLTCNPEEQKYIDVKIDQFAQMCNQIDFLTDDPLGLGGLMTDSLILMKIIFQQQKKQFSKTLNQLFSAIEHGLALFIQSRDLLQLPEQRLAFRELGLSDGLHSLTSEITNSDFKYSSTSHINNSYDSIRRISKFQSYTDMIVQFWLQPDNQQVSTWLDHVNINTVMLATSLLPCHINNYFPLPE